MNFRTSLLLQKKQSLPRILTILSCQPLAQILEIELPRCTGQGGSAGDCMTVAGITSLEKKKGSEFSAKKHCQIQIHWLKSPTLHAFHDIYRGF